MECRLSAACLCNMGRVRGNNEDNFYFDGRTMPLDHTSLDKPLLQDVSTSPFAAFGVFDGMGGEENGEVASFVAAETFKDKCRWLREYVAPPQQFLAEASAAMNDAVAAEARKVPGRVGTTGVMLCFSEDEVYCGNVGDSRAYRFHKSALFQLSTDHNDAKFLRDHGVVGRKPRLTQYIGLDPEEMMIEPSYAKEKLQQGDRYLLCSDGLTDMLDNLTLCSILKNSATVQQGVEALMDTALERGGRDNITIILVEVEEVRA